MSSDSDASDDASDNGTDDYGGNGSAIVAPQTMRGRSWACLRQFSVFMENRVGNLADLMRHVESVDLRVVALSIVDSVDCSVARIIVNNYDRGHELFKLSSFVAFETDVIGVELPDEPQPLVELCRPLLRAEVNIHYAYPLLYRKGRGGVAIYVDDIDQALTALEQSDLKIITEHDLLDDEYL